ncbi:MAG: hypothetical protein KDB65_00925 [Calditrichaeota bacterium]|nr:hypothetical protein [Calditrichota bacterium]MCB9369220.1 hypothetical protein [Calditrichota bacterium]
MNILRSFLAAIVAWFPAHYIPRMFFDREKNLWSYEATFFLVFLVVFWLATHLMRTRTPKSEMN